MSIAAETFNPEAWGYNGVEVAITIHAADHFNNPVPDGASVYFTTEGGQIQSQCQIENGSCFVNWTSANPRPDENDVPGGMAGRITILASMLGEESFIDANGNGVLDNGDPAYSNIPEAFRDDNEDGEKHPTYEEFVDFNTNGIYDDADSDPAYNGVLCCDAAAVAAAEAAVAQGEDSGVCYGVTPTTSPVCSSEKNINVRESVVLIMAENFADITLFSGTVDPGNVVTFEIVGSRNGQIMPAGTTITAELQEGNIDDSYAVPNSNFNARTGDALGLDLFRFVIPGGAIGPLTILVSTPNGNVTRADYSF
jgi:hypothetical protein